jgi:hypothetical protein
MSELSCPSCGATGGRVCGHEIRGVYDGVLYWSCFDCGELWNRWPKDHGLYDRAETYLAKARARSGIL